MVLVSILIEDGFMHQVRGKSGWWRRGFVTTLIVLSEKVSVSDEGRQEFCAGNSLSNDCMALIFLHWSTVRSSAYHRQHAAFVSSPGMRRRLSQVETQLSAIGWFICCFYSIPVDIPVLWTVLMWFRVILDDLRLNSIFALTVCYLVIYLLLFMFCELFLCDFGRSSIELRLIEGELFVSCINVSIHLILIIAILFKYESMHQVQRKRTIKSLRLDHRSTRKSSNHGSFSLRSLANR
jgi:hypothetical protein